MGLSLIHIYPQAASENYRTLCDAARTDLADNNAYWAKWEGPVKEAGSTVYTGFLRGDVYKRQP